MIKYIFLLYMIIFACYVCGNTSISLHKELNKCCYDDINLVELSDKYYFSIIKIQIWYKHKLFNRLLNSDL